MKLNCIIIALVSINLSSSFVFKKIDNIRGSVEFIEFDLDFNIYIGANNPSGVYKLSSEKEIISSDENNFGHIQKLLIAKSNNAYIFDWIDSGENYRESLHFLGQNATKIEKNVYQFPLNKWQSHVYFTDNNGNIYFNTAVGVAVLKPSDIEKQGVTAPQSVDNLEYFSIMGDHSYAFDTNNIYLVGRTAEDATPKIATVSSYKFEMVPSAEVQNTPKSNLNEVSAVSTDNEKQVIIAFSGDHARIYAYETNNYPQLKFGKYLHQFTSFFSTWRRVHFFERNLFTGDCYLNTDYRGNPGVNFKDYDCEGANFTSDSLANVFFTVGNKKVFSLKDYDTEIQEIVFPSNEPQYGVTALVVDANDDLWILAGDLYVVRRDTIVASRVTNSSFAATSGVMKIHPGTEEILIGSENGLYVYSD